MGLAAGFDPFGAEFRGEGVAFIGAGDLGDHHAGGQRQGLGVDLRTANHPQVFVPQFARNLKYEVLVKQYDILACTFYILQLIACYLKKDESDFDERFCSSN